MTKVEVKVKDLAVLAKVCKELGLELKIGQKTYRWFGKFVGDSKLPDGLRIEDLGKCDHAISVAGNSSAYEVGLRKEPDGSFRLVYDFWGSGYGLEAAVGKNCGKLMQAYSQEVAKKNLLKSGYVLSGKKKLADGSMEMVFTK